MVDLLLDNVTWSGSSFQQPYESSVRTNVVVSWLPTRFISGEYIQVDFRVLKQIEQIILYPTFYVSPVNSMYLWQSVLSDNDIDFNIVVSPSGDTLFTGNPVFTGTQHTLDPPFQARYLRLFPVDFNANYGLSWEVFGCTPGKQLQVSSLSPVFCVFFLKNNDLALDDNECVSESTHNCVHGECMNTLGSYKCLCEREYTGTFCDEGLFNIHPLNSKFFFAIKFKSNYNRFEF